jgi:hypothetical protein
MLDAVREVDVDVVFEGQPAVAARRAAPIDRVDVDAEREQVAQHRAVFLQVGHRVATDLAIGDQHRHADRALRGALVAIKGGLVLAKHHLLVRGGDLHVLVLQPLQHALAAGKLEVQVVELGDRLSGWRLSGDRHLEILRTGRACRRCGCVAREPCVPTWPSRA